MSCLSLAERYGPGSLALSAGWVRTPAAPATNVHRNASNALSHSLNIIKVQWLTQLLLFRPVQGRIVPSRVLFSFPSGRVEFLRGMIGRTSQQHVSKHLRFENPLNTASLGRKLVN